ncbi:MAG: hypothetical protein GX569_11700 [Candidatus Riflebacteria bacterium]|nr:hypothetical protein [Candidatus Riflebacteria bacterium]
MKTQPAALAREKDPESAQSKTGISDGIALEVPATLPFEGFTYLKKEWIDQEDDIESVTFGMALGHLNSPVNWENTETFVMMPEWGTSPLRRSWVVRIPTHFEGAERYLFHYFFQIRYINGSEKVSDNFTQLIMPKTVEYIDHSGSCVHIRLHWSLGNWSYPQDTELEVDGIEWGSEFSVSHTAYRSGDRLYEHGRLAAVKKIEMPRVFRAQIWAPRGEEINYCFNMLSIDHEGNLQQKWDNNGGENFKMTI